MQTVAAKEATKNNKVPEFDFAERFQDYYTRIYGYFRYRANTPEDAEDLIGITFEKAYRHRDQFDPAKGSFSTWIFRIAHNTLANYYRTHQRRSAWQSDSEMPEDLVVPEVSPETQVIRNEAIAQLLQGLKQLSERDREIISLKFASRLSNQEISRVMNLKEKTVSVVLLRAMRRLQQQVEEAAL